MRSSLRTGLFSVPLHATPSQESEQRSGTFFDPLTLAVSIESSQPLQVYVCAAYIIMLSMTLCNCRNSVLTISIQVCMHMQGTCAEHVRKYTTFHYLPLGNTHKTCPLSNTPHQPWPCRSTYHVDSMWWRP